MANNKYIMDLARIINLMNVAKGLVDIDNELISNKEYLLNILSEEVRLRNQKKQEELIKIAKLPKKTFDINKATDGLVWQLDKIKQFDFKNNNQNIFIVGDCSSGKTALSSLIGSYALTTEAQVIYLTEDDFIIEIQTKKKKWKNIIDADVIIIDEFFYVEPKVEILLLVYKILMFLNETRSLIIVTNRKLSNWKEMHVDKHLVETLQKRLLADSQIITLRSE